MRRLHVNHRFVFGNFELRKVSMDQRQLTGIGVQMEQRSIKSGRDQRCNGARGGHSSHQCDMA